LKRDTLNLSTDFDVFYNLAQLFFPFRDNHLGFYQFPTVVLDRSKFTDSASVNAYKKSNFFIKYPRCAIDLDSLERVLTSKPKDSLEGIYFYESYLKIGLFREISTNRLTGAVLSTTLPSWERGQVAIRLYEYLPNSFRAVYGHPVFKNLILENNEKFRNRSLLNSSFYSSVSSSIYKKDPGEMDHVNLSGRVPQFESRLINSTVRYIRLGNFSARPNDMKVSQAFYEGIGDSLNTATTIVDLRNNTGGAEKVSKKFFALLKKYSKKGRIHVLVNNGTMSEGEIFTLQLKTLTNVTIYGQTTRGTLAYGSNYGNREKLPSGNYEVYITDMKNDDRLLQFEVLGIVPDVILQNDADWITKVLSKTE
jgi:hypothetical protein